MHLQVLPSEKQLSAPASSAVQTGENASAVVAAHAAALIQARYVIAMKNPRDLDIVREKLLKECARPSFARVARYFKPIGDGIAGPSIRFAEAAIRLMGNIVVDTVILFDDSEKKIVQLSVSDLETNVSYPSSITVNKTVERKNTKEGDVILGKRQNAKNETVYLIEATEDNLLNKQNALISKAIRTNGLRLVPGDIIDECMWQVVETQKKEDAKDPDGEKLRIFDLFGALGVTVAQIKKHLGHDGTTLNPKELIDLRALYSAIKDGETSWREVMEAREPAQKKRLGEMVDPSEKGAAQ